MTTWADIKTQLRRSILSDDTGDDNARWTDDQLWDAYCAAQRSFASHTAAVAEMSIVDGAAKDEEEPAVVWDLSTEVEFPLPDDLCELLDTSGIVEIIDAQGERRFLDPTFYTSELSPYATENEGFWTTLDALHLDTAPGAGTTLRVRYFGYWPEPANADDDEFLVSLPRWAIAPVLYLAGAHCFVAPGARSAMIRQWNTRDDSGRPQDSALIAQADWMEKRANDELARFARQDRTNFFRAVR